MTPPRRARCTRPGPAWLTRLVLRGALLAIPLAAPVHVALAGTEEWSTFDPEAQELDDESLLDHFLTRTPVAWQSEWEHASQAFRTAQGCLTSGEWFIHTDLKIQAPLGERAQFGVLLRQSENDAESFDYLDLQFKFPTAWGTPGAWFRPIFDKSRQDFAITWDFGSDTTARQLQLAFALEDVFNNLWAFRQTQVGGLSEPYERRPYEPGVRWVSRGDRVRFETSGRWLTPSRKRVIDYSQPVPDRITTLWGTLFDASVAAKALGIEWEAATDNQQANSTDAASDGSDGDHLYFRRRWWVGFSARRRAIESVTLEARYVYQDRDTHRGPPLGPNSFGGLDRMVEGEALWRVHPAWQVRAGGMFDRIDIAESGSNHTPSYGTRNESRAFIGLEARLGRITVAGVEGIELDPEPYDVWFVHDKGFLQLQAVF